MSELMRFLTYARSFILFGRLNLSSGFASEKGATVV